MKCSSLYNYSKISLLIPILLIIFGCKKSTKNSNSSNNNGNSINMIVKWTFTLDNSTLSWSGNYNIDQTTYNYTCTSSDKGACDQQLGNEQYSVKMAKGNSSISSSSDFNACFNCTIPNKIGSVIINTANSPLSLSSYSAFEIQTLNYSCSASLPNSNITVNVTEIVPNSSHTALIKGNFSGVIGKYGGGVVNISGTFEAYNKF